MKNILFLIFIFTFVPFVGYSFDEKQLLRFKVIKICKNCDLSSSTLSKTDLNEYFSSFIKYLLNSAICYKMSNYV